MEKTENLKLPNELCQQIFNCQFEIDVGNVTEQLVSKTIQLYEAMTFFSNQLSKYSNENDFDISLTQKKHIFYQQKIKKLLSRNQVQKCLVGKHTNKKTLDFQKQLIKINQNAPQQAKLLIQYFKNHHKNQQKLIKKTINEQQTKLDQRIRRRSMSKKKENNSLAINEKKSNQNQNFNLKKALEAKLLLIK